MSSISITKMSKKPKSNIASKIPTSGRDSGTHSRSSSVSNLTTASDLHSEIGDAASDSTEDFKIDDRVWVNGTKPGHIKFIGKTQFAPGIWAGILLDEPVGKNDGSVAGIKYFTCDHLKGIFARPSKLTRTSGAISGINDLATGIVTPPKSSNVPSSRASVSSNISSPCPKYTKLKIGDRITVSSLSGLKSGTLRYIGETDFAKGEWAGIELDEPTGKNDGSVAGKRYFTSELKYGLFAPLHKVSRPGTTPVSRPGSVRGTPLMRSNSRDSISSSVSNSSRASRVKLGITSLTSTQKGRVSDGFSATSAAKAFEDAIKEKDQHIEQLLKERELDRAEFARLANHFEQIEVRSSELEEKQKVEESNKKLIKERLTDLQKKFEDIQFQLEEEKITNSDFETQLQQKNQVLKHVEEYISKESGDTFLNIKGILSGQGALSNTENAQIVSEESEQLQKKIAELKSAVNLLSKEKQEIFEQLTELQKDSGETSTKNEFLITSLNTIVQEKDDMITNLKNELNSNIEKVTQLIEDNKNLSQQILLKEEQAKGHASDVIKELGENIKSLNDHLKTKSSQLAEHVNAIEDKNNKITTLEHSLKEQADAFLQLQNENKHVSDALKLKESQYEESIAAQKSLEEHFIALNSQLETDNCESQKKINLLEEEIKTKSGLLNNYLSSIEEKENLISSLQQNFDFQATSLLQLQNEKKDLDDCLNQKELELSDKTDKQKSLEERIVSLTAQNESSISETQKKMLDLVKEIERLTCCVQEKEEQFNKTQSELSSSQSIIQNLNETVQQLSEKVQEAELNLTSMSTEAAGKINGLEKELSAFIQEKCDMKSDYEKKISALKTASKVQEDELQAKTDFAAQYESKIFLLTENLQISNDKFCDLEKKIEELSEKEKEFLREKEKLETTLKEKYEEVCALKTAIKVQEDELQAKTDITAQYESKIALLTDNLQISNDKFCALKTEIEELSKKEKEFLKEKEKLETVLKAKDGDIAEFTMKLENLKKSLDKNNISLENNSKHLESLQHSLNLKEEENNQLASKLQLAEQKVEMLNKDSSDHVVSLQNELSKVKEESITSKTHLEQELAKLRKERENLSDVIKEKNASLLEKEEISISLDKKLKYKEFEISNLLAEKADILLNVSKCNADIEEAKNNKEKLSSDLSEKEQIILDIQNEVAKSSEMLENKTKELNSKDCEINVLKNRIEEKESQFDELSKIFESSQTQLVLLKEQNEKNETLLESKESFINDFKTDQEKQLQEKEQLFKEETKKLQELINSKNEEIITKQTHISNLTDEIENKKTLVKSLQAELDAAKTDKKKMSDDSSNIYQELNNKIIEMEEKYSKLLDEKEKITKEEFQTRDAKKNLELVRDTLIQEKSVQEEIVKDREVKLEALQAEVNRMKEEFTQHKHELQHKLDVTEMELQAASELKKQLDIQHNVLEELQEQLKNSDEKCKKLEAQVQMIDVLTQEKNQLQAQVEEVQKTNKEKSELVTKMEQNTLSLEEQLNNNKNLILQKEKELSSLKEQLQKTPEDKFSSDLLVKSLEEENLALKNKIKLLDIEKVEKKSNIPTKALKKELQPEEAEEKESLLSQIDFLNSIIVDLKQKNEKLTDQLETQTTCWEEDVNLNETKKAIAPRLFCDICEIFDLHETDDCPKQESFAEEAVPQLRRAGTRQLEERPYCNNCEVFGHWTLDCEEPDTF